MEGGIGFGDAGVRVEAVSLKLLRIAEWGGKLTKDETVIG